MSAAAEVDAALGVDRLDGEPGRRGGGLCDRGGCVGEETDADLGRSIVLAATSRQGQDQESQT